MLEIQPKQPKKDTITQTIRFGGDTYDLLMELADKNNVSFNNIVNQIIEYVLKNNMIKK